MMAATPDPLGLGRLLPGPGWIVLDAARDQRFTGELVLVTDEPVRVFFDRGRIYLAERTSDPPLSVRLVQAGAVTQAQLDYGRLQILDIEHLGRLFDRVPTISRDSVLAVTDVMNEQAVSWLAAREVRSATATPYRHHESGMHAWHTRPAPDFMPPLPPPPMTLPGHEPVDPLDRAAATRSESTTRDQPLRPPRASAPPPATRVAPTDDDRPDDLVAWDEPSPLDRTTIDLFRAVDAAMRDSAAARGQSTDDPTPNNVPFERFEMIWPTGEVGEVVDLVDPTPTSGIEAGTDDDRLDEPADPGNDEPGDSGEAMAVRRAVATIDTGSLAARRRLVEATGIRTTNADPSPEADRTEPTASGAIIDGTESGDEPTADSRASALRRVIGSLRRD